MPVELMGLGEMFSWVVLVVGLSLFVMVALGLAALVGRALSGHWPEWSQREW